LLLQWRYQRPVALIDPNGRSDEELPTAYDPTDPDMKALTSIAAANAIASVTGAGGAAGSSSAAAANKTPPEAADAKSKASPPGLSAQSGGPKLALSASRTGAAAAASSSSPGTTSPEPPSPSSPNHTHPPIVPAILLTPVGSGPGSLLASGRMTRAEKAAAAAAVAAMKRAPSSPSTGHLGGLNTLIAPPSPASSQTSSAADHPPPSAMALPPATLNVSASAPVLRPSSQPSPLSPTRSALKKRMTPTGGAMTAALNAAAAAASSAVPSKTVTFTEGPYRLDGGAAVAAASPATAITVTQPPTASVTGTPAADATAIKFSNYSGLVESSAVAVGTATAIPNVSTRRTASSAAHHQLRARLCERWR
jgi:hypothetical protein